MSLNDSIIIDGRQRGTIRVPAKQNDRGYGIILSILYNGENIVEPTDTATFREAKPDGTVVYGDCVVNSDRTVTLPIDEAGQMLAVSGPAVVDVTINNGSGALKSTRNFVLDIQAAPGGVEIPSSNVWLELEALIAEVAAYDETTEAFATGTRNGVPVEPGDPAYQNNAKYYLEQTETAGERIKHEVQETGDDIIAEAKGAAAAAGASATDAEDAADRAEQAANTAGYLDVEIVNGHLIYTRTDAVDVDFELINGHLIMEAI